MDQLITAMMLGLIFSIVSMAVYLSFRISDFPDLTVDGSFTLGGAMLVTLCHAGVPLVLGMLGAMFAGALAGLCTSLICIRIKVAPILSGILMMISLYSINLRIMNQPNLNLSVALNGWPNELGFLVIIVGVLILILSLFLNTRLGLSLRASGMNPIASRAFGIPIHKMTMMNVSLSNALVAIAGALFSAIEGYADVSMGAGTLITGLASVMIAEALVLTRRPGVRLLSIIVGSLIYRLVITIALNVSATGIRVSDIHLMTTALVLVTLVLSKKSRRNLSCSI